MKAVWSPSFSGRFCVDLGCLSPSPEQLPLPHPTVQDWEEPAQQEGEQHHPSHCFAFSEQVILSNVPAPLEWRDEISELFLQQLESI